MENGKLTTTHQQSINATKKVFGSSVTTTNTSNVNMNTTIPNKEHPNINKPRRKR
jgi:hypothetical protein